MITAGDFLAGGGGVTEAMSNIPQMTCRWVLNHDAIAIRTNVFNHNTVKHYHADFYNQDETEMEPVDFIWASIECTQHSRANGGREKKIGSYTLGFELVRYIKFLRPLVIGIENVPEFKDWSPTDKKGAPIKELKGQEFERWKKTICNLGYDYHESIMNAADYGIPTRRVRYFAFFTKSELQMKINWPLQTHDKNGNNGLNKWVPCKNFIELDREGQSIFGRQFNPNVAKGKRHPLSPNTLKRIAGGIKKFAPELKFIFQYYGNGLNAQDTNTPLNTIPTKDRHVLVSVDKKQFVQDHCYMDNYHEIDEPMNPQLTRQTKQLITIEKVQFLSDYYGRDDAAHSIDVPAMTITTENSKHLVTINKKFFSKYYSGPDGRHFAFSPEDPYHTVKTVTNTALIDVKAKFISNQRNSNGKPESNNSNVESPLPSISTVEKTQFISAYFSSAGNSHSQNQSIDSPLGTIVTATNKRSLITAISNGEIDFDIKMRFLDPEELSRISTFPDGYFTHPRLRLTKKEQTKLIGNAVPPEWARLIIEPVVKELDRILQLNPKAI